MRKTHDHGADGTTVSRVPVGSYLSRSSAGRCLALLLVITITMGTASGSQRPGPQAATEQEPITPVPSPPPADPLKLVLGERLFADPRLSGDGSRRARRVTIYGPMVRTAIGATKSSMDPSLHSTPARLQRGAQLSPELGG